MSEQQDTQLDQSALDALMDAPQQYDPFADNDVAPAPPPERAEGYPVLLRLQERNDSDGAAKPAIYSKVNKEGRPYIVLALEASFDTPGERTDGYRVSDWQTSIIQQESGSSGILNLLRLMGKPAPRGLSLRQLQQYVEGIFADPQVQLAGVPLQARIRWEASYKTDEGNYSKPFLKGMNRFPLKTYAKDVLDVDGITVLHSAGEFVVDDEGRNVHEHIVDNPSGGEPVAAQLRIARYLPRPMMEEQSEGASA